MKKLQQYISINTPQLIKTCFCMAGFLLLATFMVHAQPPDAGGDVDSVPIDGGLSLLVAAGVGYGAKKIKQRRRNSQ